ncbi:MAG: hypothetical protein ACRCT8_06150 [Lacipirellulaceae bacterium]
MDQLIAEMRRAITDGRSSAIKIAAAAGTTKMHVYRIMDGENIPSAKLAEDIAAHLGFALKLEPIA